MPAVIPNIGQRWRCTNTNGSDFIISIKKLNRKTVAATVLQTTKSGWAIGDYQEDCWSIDPYHLYSPQIHIDEDAEYTYTYLKNQDKTKKNKMDTLAIKQLREKTHLSMSLCAKTLAQAGGDVDKAIILLQKCGELKKVDDIVELREGVVKAGVYDGVGRVFELNTQTDFCVKTEIFTKFVDTFLSSDHFGKAYDMEHYFTKYEDGQLLCKQVGEKVAVKRYDKLMIDKFAADVDPSLTSGVIRSYNHHSGKIAVLLGALIEDEHKDNPKILEFLDECAMQVAAQKPLGISRTDHIVQDKLNNQMPIFIEQAQNKPEKIREKMVQGKVNSWMAEATLLEQLSLIHSGKTINSIMYDLRKELNSKFVIVDFIRYELGE